MPPKRVDEMLNHRQLVSVGVNSIRSKFSKPLICSVGHSPWDEDLLLHTKTTQHVLWRYAAPKNVRPTATKSWQCVCVCLCLSQQGVGVGKCLLQPQGYVTTYVYVKCLYNSSHCADEHNTLTM